MKPDPLRIEFKKIGGGFKDGPGVSSVFDLWGLFMVHIETKQEFLLGVGSEKEAIQNTITRLETIITNLAKLTETLP